MGVIVDTGVLYALVDANDDAHQRAVDAVAAEVEAVIVPQPTLPEVCYLIASRLGAEREADFIRLLAESDWRLEPVTDTDLPRIMTLMREYADARLGFVDASVVAIAERIGAVRVYTLDRRHFGLVRPLHVDAFTLLP